MNSELMKYVKISKRMNTNYTEIVEFEFNLMWLRSKLPFSFTGSKWLIHGRDSLYTSGPHHDNNGIISGHDS